MTCPRCKEAAKFEGYRPKTFVSLLDQVCLQRAYYHCKHCGHGHCPWDEELSLTGQRYTLAVREITALAGIQESFGKAAERTLHKLAGIALSESTVQRLTESAGETLGQMLAAGQVFGPARPWSWHVDRRGKKCAYVSVDWTGILMQGAEGAKADGRMVAVGMIFNPQPRPPQSSEQKLSMPCDGVRYLAGLYALEDLGLQMRRQGGQVGMDAADIWIVLSDGGNGLENFAEVNFPGAVKILDFQHPAERLNVLAKLADADKWEALAARWCHLLKHEGGRRLVAVLEDLDRRRLSHAARAKLAETLGYLRNNLYRMNYPKYLERGWQIATGAVESACKTVVNQRLCMGGMRWGEDGGDSVAHLRALYRSDPDQWDAYWAQFAMAT